MIFLKTPRVIFLMPHFPIAVFFHIKSYINIDEFVFSYRYFAPLTWATCSILRNVELSCAILSLCLFLGEGGFLFVENFI